MIYNIKLILAIYFIFFNLDISIFDKKKIIFYIKILSVFAFDIP